MHRERFDFFESVILQFLILMSKILKLKVNKAEEKLEELWVVLLFFLLPIFTVRG